MHRPGRARGSAAPEVVGDPTVRDEPGEPRGWPRLRRCLGPRPRGSPRIDPGLPGVDGPRSPASAPDQNGHAQRHEGQRPDDLVEPRDEPVDQQDRAEGDERRPNQDPPGRAAPRVDRAEILSRFLLGDHDDGHDVDEDAGAPGDGQDDEGDPEKNGVYPQIAPQPTAYSGDHPVVTAPPENVRRRSRRERLRHGATLAARIGPDNARKRESRGLDASAGGDRACFRALLSGNPVRGRWWSVAEPMMNDLLRTETPSIPPDQQSTIGLVRAIATDTSTLVRKEVELARQELMAAVISRLVGAAAFGAAAVFGLLLVIFLALAAAAALDLIFVPWLSRLIVAGAFLLMAAGAALFAIRRLRKRKKEKTPDTQVQAVINVLPEGMAERISDALEDGRVKQWAAAGAAVWILLRLVELRQLRRMNRMAFVRAPATGI